MGPVATRVQLASSFILNLEPLPDLVVLAAQAKAKGGLLV
jgi:hypothetical protein